MLKLFNSLRPTNDDDGQKQLSISWLSDSGDLIVVRPFADTPFYLFIFMFYGSLL